MNKNFSASRKGTSPNRLFTFVLAEGIGVVIAISLIFVLERVLGVMSARPTRIAIAFPIFFVPFTLFCLAYGQRGHLRSAIRLYIWGNFAAITLAILVFGGVRSSAWILFFWTVAVAEALIGPGFALGISGIVTMFFILLFILQMMGWFTPLMTLGPEVRDFEYIAFTLLMIVSSVGLMGYLKERS